MAETVNRNESQTLRDVKLLFRNFSGRAGQFNAEGSRNFHILLDDATARDLEKRGWRVKQMKDQDDGTPGDKHLKVNVNYNTGRPPRVVLVTSKGQTDLGPDEVATLDVADIEKSDLVLNGWYSDMAGGGYSAFLKTLFVTIREDELELLYAINPADTSEHEDNWNE